MTRILFILGLLILPMTVALGQDKTLDPGAIKFFETSVRPVLANRCFSCHGPEMQKNKLRVDSLAALLQGGKSGPAFVAGKPDESLLIRAIRHGEALQMPPRMKLPAKEIADLTAWVKMGAPWPNAKLEVVDAEAQDRELVFTKEQTGHWALQPVHKPKAPAVKNNAWVRSPIDAFILARLEEKGLTPAPAADARTLIRRVYFDLIGLPPSPEEVDAFVTEFEGATPQAALEKLVDRLLASPRYGERWGRHWLDMVRYADSNGMDENLVFGNAWRYRDYVVRAFNTDLTYDQFVREQIAGDLLEEDGTNRTSDRLTATGFLSIGPKMLAEDDPVKMEMDIIDEQVDTLGRAFLGMTFGCCRCHDHKYDPISIGDYYSLAGIFKSTKTMDNFRVVARWQERPIGTSAETEKAQQHAKQVAELKGAILQISERHYQEALKPARLRANDYLQSALALKNQTALELHSNFSKAQEAKQSGLIVVEAEDYARGNARKSFDGYGDKIGVIYNNGELPNIAEYDVTLKDAGRYQLELRYAAAAPRPVQVIVNGQLATSKAAGKVTGSWYPDTQTWFAESVLSLKAGANVIRLECAGPFPHFDKLALIPTEQPAPKTLDQWAKEANLHRGFLKQWLEYVQKNQAPLDAADLKRISLDAKGPLRLTVDVEAGYSEAAQNELRDKRAQLAKLEQAAPSLPEAMAVSDGKPADLRVHLRGNHLTLGKDAPRRFPRVFSSVKQSPIDATQSGRLQLAHWITQPEHPLTSRVMVNRLWHWHFGTGLVRSVDNFGMLGEKPSHPELLDWIAAQFVDSGWSLKAMHRQIILSSTYQMSAAYDDGAFQIDPDNRLHWRHNRRRLEAEALRDSLYVLGGNLDLTVGGTLFDAKNRAYVPGYPNGNYEKYDIPRRSVYLPVVRSALYDVLQAFDFADPSFPSGERATTTVTPQALFLMNGKIVHEQTRSWTTKWLADKSLDDAGRIRRLYLQAFSRPPSDREIARSLEFIERIESEFTRKWATDARTQAWQSFCRVIVSANEFVYVE